MSKSGQGQVRAQTEAGELQAVTAQNVGQRQSLTALEAAEMRALSIEQASAISAAGYVGGGYSADPANTIIQDNFNQTEQRLEPFTQVGDESLAAIQSGATSAGFEARLASIIDGGSYTALRDERFQVADARASAAGLNRSGAALQEASDISTQTALGLDSELYQRQLNNVNIDYQASNSLSNFGQAAAGQVAGFTQSAAAGSASAGASNSRGQANAQAQGILGAANARATGLEDSAFYETSGVTGAANARADALVGSEDVRAQARQNRTDTIIGVANAAATLFGSDERLKENMTPIGKIADLIFYKWDWKPQFKGMVGMEMNKGFGASEVQRKYPHCVHEIKGVKLIDYSKLTNILQARLAA